MDPINSIELEEDIYLKQTNIMFFFRVTEPWFKHSLSFDQLSKYLTFELIY